MIRKERRRLLIIICLIALIAVGAKAIELTVNEPIIDLNLLVTDSIGVDGGMLGPEDGNSTVEVEDKIDYHYEPYIPETVISEHKECRIEIYKENIKFDYNDYSSADDMRERLQDHINEGANNIYLIDYYAEYNTYLCVDTILRQLLGEEYDSIVVLECKYE